MQTQIQITIRQKMTNEAETLKEATEEQKKRIMKNTGLEVTTLEPGSKLGAKLSDKYVASIQAAIRPNITFDPDTISGNPAVELQVGLRADGSISSVNIVKTSGMKSWDTAAARALDKTERLPKDENGRVPSTLEITLRPRER